MITRLGTTLSMLVCGFALLIACSGKDDHGGGFIDTSPNAGASNVNRAGAGGAGGRAQTDGGGSAGKAGGSGGSAGGTVSLLAPKVEIIAPKAASDPNTDAVLIEDQLTVLCKAAESTAKNASPVDASSVKIAMLDADGNELKSASGTPTQNDDEYTAAFVLSAVPSGSVTFQCTASDESSDRNAGSDSVDTFVDHGPEISIVDPADMSAHNLLGPMSVEFDTAPALLTKGDKQADVSEVTLTVYGAKIPTKSAGGGKYTATVDFADKSVFSSAPTGTVPIVLTASNKRKAPGKATQSLSYSIVLDGTGPTLTLVSPAASAVVGRASVFKFTAIDAGAGVDRDTVYVKLNDTYYYFSATDGKWSVESGTFTFLFGGEILAKKQADTQITVNVGANDKAGNSTFGLAVIYNLDNTPPVVDLDPPNLYEAIVSGTNTKQCSDYFDPVGSAAPNDLETITNFGRFRALVWDDTNTKAGQSDFYFAQTDRSSVQLFVQYDKDAPPLLYDTDADGVCDEIRTGVFPHQKNSSDKPIPYLGLGIVAPNSARGGVTYPSSAVDTPLDQACTGGKESTYPHLCLNSSSDMSVVIHHGTGVSEPVIYAISPIDDSGKDKCTGTEWDVPTAVSKVNGGEKYYGWACVAGRALDNVGNWGVSAPLRVCLDDGTNLHRCDNDPPPTCTDNCTPPGHFNRIVSHN